MAKINFQEVSCIATKAGKCPKCGKKANRAKKFYQTLSPFNVMKDGMTKTATDIQKELWEEIKKWRDEPIYHAKCE